MATVAYYLVFIFIHLLANAISPASTVVRSSKSSQRLARMEELRRASRQVSRGNGNALFDEAIPGWQEWLLENGYDPFHLNQYEVEVSAARLIVKDCNIVGLSTFMRTGDITVNLTEAGFSGQGEIGLGKLSVACDAQIRWSLLRANGKLTASVADFSAEASVVQSRPPPRITSLRITNEGTIDLEFIGDGFVGTLLQWLTQGYLKYRVQLFLADTDRVIALANEAIEGVDIENIITTF